MGQFDYVPEVLNQIGVKVHFSEIAVKPGKPTVFGTFNEKFLFGLPGNPVSTFVIFEVLLKPFIYRTMGYKWEPVMFFGTLNKRFFRKKSERACFIPVFLRAGGQVELPDYHGSAHLQALSQANGLLMVEAGVKELKPGQKVNVRQL